MFAQNICSLKFHLSCHHPNINHRKGTPNGFHKRNWFESWMKCEEFAIGFVCIPMHPWNRKWYYDWWFVVHILLFHVQWHSTWSSIWYHNSKSMRIINIRSLFIIEVSTLQMISNDYLKWHLCSVTRKKQTTWEW